MSHPVRWPRLATLLAAIGLAGFLSLGIWQVQRLHWKLDLIERVDARVTADPVPAERKMICYAPKKGRKKPSLSHPGTF